MSHDALEATGLDVDQTNPKLGLQWNINNWLRFRLAAFRMVKRVLITDQTLEPTTVAGFNQFFDDFNGTKAKRYGLGLDAAPLENVYAGIEASRRDLRTPFPTIKPDHTTEFVFEDREEKEYRAFVYWALHRRVALSAEYLVEKFRRDQRVDLPLLLPTNLETIKVPIALHLFGPSGIFAELGATYVRQNLDTVTEIDPVTVSREKERFTVFDASLGYRLPKRRGIFKLEARNLLDEDFQYQDRNFLQPAPGYPEFFPDRTLVARLTLNF